MFYYLSFLRPPPTAASDGSITITPQIANDLRTELYSGTCDIFYAWLLSSPPHLATKMSKLTSWKQQSSAYKEIAVPLPSGARSGQSWGLVLTAKPAQLHVFLNECSTLGRDPFPVRSMPIQIVQKAGKSVGKQEQIERIYKLTRDPERLLTIRERTSFDLDKKVWDSGIGLSSWIIDLTRNKLSPDASPLLVKTRETLLNSNSCNVIELGAGTGIVSLTLGAVRSSLHPTSIEGNIFTTDLASAMPLLSHNISANSPHFATSSMHPQALPLNWDDSDLPPQIVHDLHGFDAILMADVTYNTSSFPSLLRTISSLIAHTTARLKPPPLIILAYKERDPDERTLWDLFKGEVGVCLQQVGKCIGNGGAPVEFWVGVASTPQN